jgi:hypothetical protein
MLFTPEVAMTIRIPMRVILAVSLSIHAHAKAQESSCQPDLLFRQVSAEEAAAVDSESALVMGTYVLDTKATEQLMQVDTLRKAINRIRLTDWKTGVWTKQRNETWSSHTSCSSSLPSSG